MGNNLLSERLVYNGESRTPTHLHLCAYDAAACEETAAERFGDLLPHLGGGRILWLQVHGLRDTDTVRDVCAHFGIDFLTMQDILNVSHPSKIEEREAYNVVISKLSAWPDEPGGDIRQTHFCLVQGNGFVLTFLEEESDFFRDVTQAIRANTLHIRERHADYLLSVLLNGLVGNFLSVVSRIDDALDELETSLFDDDRERDAGVGIRLLRKRYLLMKQTVYPLKDQYARLFHAPSSALFRRGTRAFFSDVNDHLAYVAQTIDSCRETLSALMDLYVSNNSLRMNDIMTRLTVVSTIFIPLTFLAGVWGMNFRWMPELDWRYGYPAAWGLMLATGVAVYVYLKRKKW